MTDSALPSMPAMPAMPAVAQPRERVALGIAASLGAVLLGVVLTVAIWRAGYVASISSFVMAAGAVWLYKVGAGRPPARGLPGLIVVIVLGVVLSFFAIIASDLSQAYDEVVGSGGSVAVSKSEFIRRALTDGAVLSAYGRDAAMFVLFTALGVFSAARRLRPRRG